MISDRELLEGEPLTPREVEVLYWAAEGDTAHETAKRLFLAEDTIKTHKKRSVYKLGARNTAHAVAIALRSGILDCEERKAA